MGCDAFSDGQPDEPPPQPAAGRDVCCCRALPDRGCAVLAMARPFVPAGSTFPWWLVPLGLLGIVFFGMSFALGRYRRWQVLAWLAACSAWD
jgi:hypothetical protein